MSGRETRDDAGYVPFGGLLLLAAGFFAPVGEDLYRSGRITAAVVGEIVDGAGVRVAA